MKKITKLMVGITLILSIILAACQFVYAKQDPTTIDLVVGRFNACTLVQAYNDDPSTMNLSATNTDTSLTVTVTENEVSTNLEYSFNPSTYILNARYVGNDATVKEYWREVTKIIIDCIGQLNNGYGDGYLYKSLNTSEISNYKLSENGFEITDNPNSTAYLAEININKEIATINENMYIKEADLQPQKDKIMGDDETEPVKKGNALFYKYTIDNLDYIVIGEKGDLTSVANKSLTSALKVFFGSNAEVDYFFDNYSSLANKENKRFEGFKVEINPIKTEDEEEVLGSDGSYQFARITIDRDAVKEALTTQKSSNSSSGESSSGSSSSTGSSSGSDTLPKTGGEVNVPLLVLYGIMGAAGVGIIILTANSKKEK